MQNVFSLEFFILMMIFQDIIIFRKWLKMFNWTWTSLKNNGSKELQTALLKLIGSQNIFGRKTIKIPDKTLQ